MSFIAVYAIAPYVLSFILTVEFYSRLREKIYPNKVIDKKSKIIIISIFLGTIISSVVSVGFFPGMLIHILIFPIYFFLGIDINGEEWWGHSIDASILILVFILPAFIMSKYFSLSGKRSQKKILLLFAIVFSLFIGVISAALPELFGIY